MGVVVGVQVAVEVKNNVRVGAGEAVGVRAVEMGEVPSSAWEVSATAVRVLLAFRSSASLAGPPEATQTASNSATKMPETPSACK